MWEPGRQDSGVKIWEEIKQTIKLTGYKSHGSLKGEVSI